MAHILSRSELEAAANKRKTKTYLFEAVKEVKTFSKKLLADYTIFLSHSHEDKSDVEALAVFFDNLGIKLYVDWLDDAMPPTTSAETAKNIKEKIKESQKFILLATNKAIASVWCNWELGCGDAFKFIDHIAIFPVSDNDGSWKGREYFRIYLRIEREYQTLDDNQYYKIIYPDGTKKDLIRWLKNKPR